MTDFAILRVAKIKSLGGLTGGSAHNSRTASEGLAHVNNTSPLMGGGCQLVAGCDDAVQAWKDRAQQVKLPKPRKDAVRALEVVMTVSPDWFRQATPDERDRWKNQSMAWVSDAFGEDNILSAHLHDDEETPHLHVLAIPLSQKERKRAGRPRKGRESQGRRTVKAWGLCAAEIVGTPTKMVELQTSYAKAVSDLGIRRGRPRRATGARHLSPTQYRAQLAESLSEANDARAVAIGELNEARISAADITAAAEESAAAFTTGLDAIDQEEITYDDKHDRLAWNKVEHPVLPVKTKPLRQWKKAVKPFFGALLRYAQKVSQVKRDTAFLEEKSAQVSQRERQVANDAATVTRLLSRAGQSTAELKQIQRRPKQIAR